MPRLNHTRGAQVLTAVAIASGFLCVPTFAGSTEVVPLPIVERLDPAQTAENVHWFHPDWTYRIRIVARPDSIQGSGVLTEFPLALRLGAGGLNSLFTHARPDGRDLVVTKGDFRTPLQREIITFDSILRDGEVWFKADSLSKTINTFYLYYGNPDTLLPLADGGTWTGNHLAAYHFSEDPSGGQLIDHGPEANHSLALPAGAWNSSHLVAGQVGRGWQFNGTSHWLDSDNISSSDSSFTITSWFALWNQLRPGDADFAFSGEASFWHLSAKRNSMQRMPDYAGPGGFIAWRPNPIPDTLLHQYTWVMDGVADTLRFFFDGREQTIFVRFAQGPDSKVYRGHGIGGNVSVAGPVFTNPFDLMEGIVDEFRVYRGVRSPNWIRTEYRNQKSTLTFFDYFMEETVTGVPVTDVGPNSGPIRYLAAHPNPFQASTAVSIELDQPAPLDVRIYGVTGRLIRVLKSGPVPAGPMVLSWNGIDAAGRSVGAGVYFLRVEAGSAAAVRRLVLGR